MSNLQKQHKKATREWLISQAASSSPTTARSSPPGTPPLGEPADIEESAVIHDNAFDSSMQRTLDAQQTSADGQEEDDDLLENLSKDDFKDAKTFAVAIKKRVPVYVPVIKWIQSYSKQDAIGDVLAAVTTAVMLVPQGLAYAILAGLPPVVGLYTGWMPLIVYAAMGSCRQLAVGPEALFAVLLGSILSKFSPDEAFVVANGMAVVVGIISLTFGVARFGFMHNIMSRWVLSGFINAVALIIAFTQLDALFGFKFEKGLDPYEKLFYTIEHMGHETNVHTLGIAIGTIIFLFASRVIKSFLVKKGFKNAKYFPEVMLSVVMGILIVYITRVDEHHGVKILGDINGGFPVPQLPRLHLVELQDMLADCLLMVIVGFVEATAVSRALATKHNYQISANRELVAFGAANIIGSFFQTYPCFSSIPRTSIQDSAGSRTCLCGFLTSCLLLITILFLTPLFHFLPNVTMAAIIFVAAFGLIEVHEAIFLYKTKSWTDLLQFAIAFLTTFILEVEVGILVSVGMCIFLVLKHSSTPHVYSVLGRLPATNYFKDVAKYPEAQPIEGVILVRIDEQLMFANMGEFKLLLDDLEQLTSKQIEEGSKTAHIQAIAINCSNIPKMDASALLTMLEMVETYHHRNVRVCFIQLDAKIKQAFALAGLTALVGEESFFESNHGCIRYLEANVIKKTLNREGYSSPQDKELDTQEKTYSDDESGPSSPALTRKGSQAAFDAEPDSPRLSPPAPTRSTPQQQSPNLLATDDNEFYEINT